MKKTMPVVLSAMVLFATATAAATESPAPYAGWQERAIKALSPQEVDDLRAGRGMGLALAAELNGYPGPRHVLDLAAPLELTAEQRHAVQVAFDTMQREARRLGVRVLQKEAVLDGAFRGGRAGETELRAKLATLAALQGELRYVHLRSHLTVRALLSADQVARYNHLRGYATGESATSHGGHSHSPAKP
jgi:hypothetical protein